MVELGLFEDERVELLHGTLVTMTPQGPRHAELVTRLTHLFFRVLAGRAQVRTQCPFAAADDSEPEPDIAIVPVGDYYDDHPTKAFLVVEVADASLRKDRNVKPSIYAASGVPEYWVVNIVEGTVEAYSRIENESYAHVRSYKQSDVITLIEFPDVEVQVSDFLR